MLCGHAGNTMSPVMERPMPASLTPLITIALLVGTALWFLISKNKASRRTFVVAESLLCAILLGNFLPGGIYWMRARAGSPAAMYELARWTESHDENIGEYILWPFVPDVDGGYVWLERAAALDYPPALYALGLRLKHGMFVDEPAGWKRGQPLIDRAIALGHQPVANEETFSFGHYRY